MITSDKILHFYVKIRQGPKEAMAETVYYRTDMSFEFAMRWMWYFEYRAARFRVEKPRYYTKLEIVSYEPDPRTVHKVLAERMKRRIIIKKARITGISNQLRKTRQEWCSSKPIELDPFYVIGSAKVQILVAELKTMEKEYEEFAGKMKQIFHN